MENRTDGITDEPHEERIEDRKEQADISGATVEPEAMEPAAEPPKAGGLKHVFVNRFGHIRAGWRILIYFVVSAGLLFLAGLVMHAIAPEPEAVSERLRMIVGSTLMCAGFIAGAAIVLKFIDRRPVNLLGFGFYKGFVKEGLIGIAIGFSLLTVLFFIFLVTGLVEVTMNPFSSSTALSLLSYIILFLFSGASEELMMRGYGFQALIEGANFWIALALFSLLFSAGHISNPNVTWNGLLNIVLAGLLLGVAYYKTRALWLPTGLHMAWNFTQGPLWGMNVSGMEIQNPVFTATPQGPELLSGGAFGAEGSLISSVFILALTIYLWKTSWLKPADYNRRLWSAYPASFGKAPEPEFEPAE